MLSLDLIRRDPEFVAAALVRRGDEAPVDDVLALDEKRRSLQAQADRLRAHRNETSRNIGRMTGDRSPLIAQMRQVGQEIADLDQQHDEVQAQLQTHCFLACPTSLNRTCPTARAKMTTSWSAPAAKCRHLTLFPSLTGNWGNGLGSSTWLEAQSSLAPASSSSWTRGLGWSGRW